MAKTAMIVATCVVSIVVLFVIFSYLLSIVNPGLMVTNGTYSRRAEELQDFDDDKSDIMYPNEELTAKDNVHFGLEKVSDDYDIFPYEVDTTENVEIDKRFAHQKPVRNSPVTFKSNNRLGDVILTSDGKKPVSLIVFPSKDNRRLIREKKNKKIGSNPKNVLLKIIDDSGQAKLEVIADSARLVYEREVNDTKNELGTDRKVLEIRPNTTLLYNIKDQSFKIVDNKKPCINKISTFNTTLRQKNVEQVMEKSSKNQQDTNKISSHLTGTTVTTETYILTSVLESNNLSLATEVTTITDSLNTVTILRKK